MSYLLAKRQHQIGCYALRLPLGEHFVEFKRSLLDKVGYEDIQLVTISRPSAYGEYDPYHFVHSEEEFAEKVMELKRVGDQERTQVK